MVKGRKPKTAEEHVRRGNPSRLSKEELASRPRENLIDYLAPQMPEDLFQEAIDVWERFVPRMVAIGAVCCLDEELLADYCRIVATKNIYQKILDEEGEYHVNENKTQTMRSEVKLVREMRKEEHRLGELLGLSPKARRNLNIIVRPPKPVEQPKPDSNAQKKASILKRQS